MDPTWIRLKPRPDSTSFFPPLACDTKRRRKKEKERTKKERKREIGGKFDFLPLLLDLSLTATQRRQPTLIFSWSEPYTQDPRKQPPRARETRTLPTFEVRGGGCATTPASGPFPSVLLSLASPLPGFSSTPAPFLDSITRRATTAPAIWRSASASASSGLLPMPPTRRHHSVEASTPALPPLAHRELLLHHLAPAGTHYSGSHQVACLRTPLCAADTSKLPLAPRLRPPAATQAAPHHLGYFQPPVGTLRRHPPVQKTAK